jgi:pimeloyl-ACP methyl ester carboxylesterase
VRVTTAFASEDYDEFQFLEQHASWAGLPWTAAPRVVREACVVDGAAVSYLRWGEGDPEAVLLHGTGQNAHTWDTFAMALGRPCLALDLPGHGRSDWREDGDYLPHRTGPTVAAVVAELAPRAKALVGMSLGGLIGLRALRLDPGLARALVLVDITPRSPGTAAIDDRARNGALTLLSGSRRYESWEAMLDAVHATMPRRERDSLVPGVRHNARRFDDGSWGWRYDELRPSGDPIALLEQQWEDFAGVSAEVLLVRGGRSPIVSDAHVELLRRHVPTARVETVAGAGHAVQTDRPVELARLVDDVVR